MSASADGMDLDVCSNFLIKGCRFTVKDDAICFKGGKVRMLVCPRGVDTRRMILSMLKYINSL